MEWLNNRDKRREDAEKADYSDAGDGGKPKGDGGKPKGDGGKPKGDGGKPKGGGSQPIPMYGGGGMVGYPPGSSTKFPSSLASLLGRQSSSAVGTNRNRKKGMSDIQDSYHHTSKESTWDRINKYR